MSIFHITQHIRKPRSKWKNTDLEMSVFTLYNICKKAGKAIEKYQQLTISINLFVFLIRIHYQECFLGWEHYLILNIENMVPKIFLGLSASYLIIYFRVQLLARLKFPISVWPSSMNWAETRSRFGWQPVCQKGCLVHICCINMEVREL